jgi:hypothetical protein
MRLPSLTFPRSCLCAVLLSGLAGGPARAQESTFDILKGGEVVGSVAASRTKTGDHTLYVMTSYSEMNMIWKQIVTSAMTVEYVGEVLRACMSSIHVNGAVRDSSHMDTDSEGLLCHVYPHPPFRRSQALPWTTARMYFEEPVGQDLVFVESVLTPCSLRTIGPGNYLLLFPNGAESRYVYARGQLQEIHVDRMFIDLLFKRKGD